MHKQSFGQNYYHLCIRFLGQFLDLGSFEVQNPLHYQRTVTLPIVAVFKEQGVVFTPSINLDTPLEDSTSSVVGKFVFGAIHDDVLKHGPCSFNKEWFALHPLDPKRSIDEYSFDHMTIWVCILRIMIGLMSEALGSSFGSCLDIVVGTDTQVIDGNMGDFLSVHIVTDTSKLICRCVALCNCGDKPKLCPL
ncbi:hypothetical protein V6N13_033643 [Hibiscus sabdariffa]